MHLTALTANPCDWIVIVLMRLWEDGCNAEAVKLVLDLGAAPDQLPDKEPPVSAAVFARSADGLWLLLDRGASVEARFLGDAQEVSEPCSSCGGDRM
jgi:hypothetical protein